MSTQRIQEMVGYYSLRAPIYDVSMRYDHPDTLARNANIISSLKAWFQDRSILEVACGPGFWTVQLVPVAKEILATDANQTMLDEALKKHLSSPTIQFRIADAYSLDSIDESFDGAFAGDWWSHIPKERIVSFLEILTTKLRSGARVAFTDQLANGNSYREGSYFDNVGNHIQRRHLPDGSQFEVIKNFPSEADLHSVIGPLAIDVQYQAFPECRRWLLTFTKK